MNEIITYIQQRGYMVQTLSATTDYKEYTMVYADFYPLIFSAIYSKINKYDQSEDICQEVFIRLFDKFDEVQDVRKWLYGTMRNVILEFYRSKSMKEKDIDDLVNDASMSFVNGFRETRMIIAEVLEHLKKDDAKKEGAVFELVALYNFPYHRAASLLGLTLQQVRYKYKKAEEKILSYLKTKGIDNLEALL